MAGVRAYETNKSSGAAEDYACLAAKDAEQPAVARPGQSVGAAVRLGSPIGAGDHDATDVLTAYIRNPVKLV